MICRYARRVSAANLGIFFVLFFAPLGNVTIPGFGGLNMLFAMNNGRLLSILLLLPALFWARNLQNRDNSAYSVIPDWLIVVYTLLLIMLEFRRSDLTNVMRVAFQDTLDVIVPYFAFSRT